MVQVSLLASVRLPALLVLFFNLPFKVVIIFPPQDLAASANGASGLYTDT